jgi:hypothetical protein
MKEELTRKETREILSLLELNGLGVHEVRAIVAAIDKGLTIQQIEEWYNQKISEKTSVVKIEKKENVPFVDEILPDYFFYSLNYPCKGVFQTTKKMLGWASSCQQDVVVYYDNKIVSENLLGKEFSDIFSILEIRKEKNIIELNEILGKEGMEKTSFLDYLKFYKTYRKDPSFKGVKIFTSEEIFNEGVSNIQRGAFLLPVKINGSIMFQPLTNNLGIPILKFPAGSLFLIKKNTVL